MEESEASMAVRSASSARSALCGRARTSKYHVDGKGASLRLAGGDKRGEDVESVGDGEREGRGREWVVFRPRSDGRGRRDEVEFG